MLALFGIGQLGSRLYFELKSNGIKVDFLLDNNKDDSLDGLVITKPSNVEPTLRRDTTVIISTFKQELAVDELLDLANKLTALGYKRVLNFQECINEYGLEFEYFYLGIASVDEACVQEVYKLLSDELSRKIYTAHINFRSIPDIETLHVDLSMQDQYLPDFFINHLVSLGKSINIVDCGACYGDLILTAKEKSLAIGSYFAFEPDTNNRAVLVSNIIKIGTASVVLPLGVGLQEKDLRFRSGNGMGSCFDENGDTLVKIMNLDSCIFERIDFIKMDIEGFEAEAIKGANRIILEQKPALAISLYHKPADIYKLPLMLKGLYDNFYVRQHGRYGFDLVLYCF